MLSAAPIRAYIPVANLQRARKFYEETVGLDPGAVYGGGVIYKCGDTEVFMYPTANAGTSKASQAFWQVDDVEAEVDRKSTRLNSSHSQISYAVFCLKKKKKEQL